MKTNPRIDSSYLKTLSRLGLILFTPLLATSLLAQPAGPELKIAHAGDRNCVLTWPVTSQEYVVISSDFVDGRWRPLLDSVTEVSGTNHMTVSATDQTRYFKLAQGQRLVDDFEDGDLEGWTITSYPDPVWQGIFQVEPTNGTLRIRGTCPSCTDRDVFLYRTNLMLADFSMSIDILGWDERAGDVPTLVMISRMDPSSVYPLPSWAYGAGLRTRGDSNPNVSAVYFIEFQGNTKSTGGWNSFAKMHTSVDYRFVVRGTGGSFNSYLVDLSTGEKVVNNWISDPTLTEGWVGFYVTEHGSSGTLDFTLDNFVAVGTTP
jgi:hypothetical protein